MDPYIRWRSLAEMLIDEACPERIQVLADQDRQGERAGQEQMQIGPPHSKLVLETPRSIDGVASDLEALLRCDGLSAFERATREANGNRRPRREVRSFSVLCGSMIHESVDRHSQQQVF